MAPHYYSYTDVQKLKSNFPNIQLHKSISKVFFKVTAKFAANDDFDSNAYLY